MSDSDNAVTVSPSEAKTGKRVVSEIAWPYSDLESAIELPQTILTKAGSSAELDEIAAWMNQTAAGGTFRTRVSAAKLFGLIDTGQAKASLTQLGRNILNSDGSELSARVEAFLNIELFARMYEQHKGNALPPAAAIERQMEQLGVAPKQKERARQTFMKSAQYAGFIDSSTGRFVKPGNASSKPPDGNQKKNEGGGGNGGGGGTVELNLDPLLIELLKKIPATGSGWPEAQRVRWFRTFAMNVSQIYDNDDKPIELDIKIMPSVS